MATITTERLQWLWSQFSQNVLTTKNQSLQPPPQNFETEILWLIQRYITILPKRKPKTIQPNNIHNTLHPDITKILIESFKITHSYYSSPLTCPIQLAQYYSPHNRDTIFGSKGHAQSSRWNGIGLAYPTYHKTTVEALHWARMATKANPNTTTILIINHKDWTSQQIPLTAQSRRTHHSDHSPTHNTIYPYTGMAKILPICRTISHINNMCTWPNQPNTRPTNPTRTCIHTKTNYKHTYRNLSY